MKDNQHANGIKAEINEKQVATLGKAFWRIVHLYRFTRAEQALLLGIKENKQRLIDLEGKNAIPSDPDKFQRVGNLVGIHKNLRIIFPENRSLVHSWMKTKSSLFDGHTPLQYIAADYINSLVRIFIVRRKLDLLRISGF